MKAEFVVPFVQAAKEVLEAEVGGEVGRGQLGVRESSDTTGDVTALVGVTGGIRGIVMYAMSRDTAKAIVSRIVGQEVTEFDSMAQSGIAELGNVITGRASTLMAERALSVNISPPVLIMGQGTTVSTLDIKRLVIPLSTEFGDLEVQLALREVNGHR